MVISIYLANIAILTDAGLYQSFRMIDTQDSLKFEPWKLVYVYIYIILFWSRTWWTRLERRESMKREHKKVWQSVSLREREKRGKWDAAISDISVVCFVCFIAFACALKYNTTAVYSVLCPKHPIFSNYIYQDAKLRLLSFCGFVHYKIESKDWNSLTLVWVGRGIFFFFSFNSIIYKV